MNLETSRIRPLVVPMVLLAAAGLLALGGYAWLLVASPGRATWWVAVAAGALVLWVVPLSAGGVACMVACVYGRPPRAAIGPARTTLRLLFPVVFELTRCLGGDAERVQAAFVYVHNRLVTAGLDAAGGVLQPSSTLVLLPHCLQRTDCPHRITWDVTNCRRCGRCPIGDVLDLSVERGFRLAVASGGTQARRLLREEAPEAVVAVACERELAEGIRDVGSIPVLAVCTQRPEGPCRNTSVSTSDLEATLCALDVRGDA